MPAAPVAKRASECSLFTQRELQTMANTTSAKKAVRKIARRTEVNKARRTRMRSAVRRVEEAIAAGDRGKATEALKAAEPEIMRAAQNGIVHKNNASRKVSRLSARVVKLAQ
jgi:small subunit ribosomal protein S20